MLFADKSCLQILNISQTFLLLFSLETISCWKTPENTPRVSQKVGIPKDVSLAKENSSCLMQRSTAERNREAALQTSHLIILAKQSLRQGSKRYLAKPLSISMTKTTNQLVFQGPEQYRLLEMLPLSLIKVSETYISGHQISSSIPTQPAMYGKLTVTSPVSP